MHDSLTFLLILFLLSQDLLSFLACVLRVYYTLLFLNVLIDSLSTYYLGSTALDFKCLIL